MDHLLFRSSKPEVSESMGMEGTSCRSGGCQKDKTTAKPLGVQENRGKCVCADQEA